MSVHVEALDALVGPDGSPAPEEAVAAALAAAVRCCLEATVAATTCADACLEEPDVADLRACIRATEDLADVARATAAVLGRRGATTEPAVAVLLLQTCAAAAGLCADLCGEHAARLDHCALCATVARSCSTTCTDVAVVLGR